MNHRTLITLAAMAVLVIGCSSESSPTPEESVAASLAASASASPSEEPTATASPTASPVPTAVPAQELTVDLSMTSARGTIEGPGRCDIGLKESSLYLEHREGGTLDVYITLGPAAGGISGPGLTPGGGTYGPEAVRIRVVDPAIGSFVDAIDPEMTVAAGLKSGTFAGTWKDEPLTGEFSCS
ncbi:MAG: hypothetical protein WD116_00735 [Chloroflexota bacterium]